MDNMEGYVKLALLVFCGAVAAAHLGLLCGLAAIVALFLLMPYEPNAG